MLAATIIAVTKGEVIILDLGEEQGMSFGLLATITKDG